MFGCSQRVRVLLFEMLSKCMFREPKSAEEGKDYLEKDKQNRQQSMGHSSLREVMFHHKLDAICSKLFFFGLFSLTLNVQKLFVKLCHSCNFVVKNQLQTDSNVQASH